ncbi:unnamed protein product [Amoebophrya sp. A25]|nr:unnamed protein product [Amoebophrya sp. A25]|eukprot:GSA25T00002969001.1
MYAFPSKTSLVCSFDDGPRNHNEKLENITCCAEAQGLFLSVEECRWHDYALGLVDGGIDALSAEKERCIRCFEQIASPLLATKLTIPFENPCIEKPCTHGPYCMGCSDEVMSYILPTCIGCSAMADGVVTSAKYTTRYTQLLREDSHNSRVIDLEENTNSSLPSGHIRDSASTAKKNVAESTQKDSRPHVDEPSTTTVASSGSSSPSSSGTTKTNNSTSTKMRNSHDAATCSGEAPCFRSLAIACEPDTNMRSEQVDNILNAGLYDIFRDLFSNIDVDEGTPVKFLLSSEQQAIVSSEPALQTTTGASSTAATSSCPLPSTTKTPASSTDPSSSSCSLSTLKIVAPVKEAKYHDNCNRVDKEKIVEVKGRIQLDRQEDRGNNTVEDQVLEGKAAPASSSSTLDLVRVLRKAAIGKDWSFLKVAIYQGKKNKVNKSARFVAEVLEKWMIPLKIADYRWNDLCRVVREQPNGGKGGAGSVSSCRTWKPWAHLLENDTSSAVEGYNGDEEQENLSRNKESSTTSNENKKENQVEETKNENKNYTTQDVMNKKAQEEDEEKENTEPSTSRNLNAGGLQLQEQASVETPTRLPSEPKKKRQRFL